MKRIHILLAVGVIALSSVQAKAPDWIKATPTPENDTYLYVIGEGVGSTESSAENKAIAQVMQQTAMRLGLTVNIDAVNHSLIDGTPYDGNDECKTAVNRVCRYVLQHANGEYRCYVLCQVSNRAPSLYPPQWMPFSKCGNSYDKSVSEFVSRPSDWAKYEDATQYVSSFQHKEFPKTVSETEALDELIQIALNDLKQRLNITEDDLLHFSTKEKKFIPLHQKETNDGFVVVSVPVQVLAMYYRAEYSRCIYDVENYLLRAQNAHSESEKRDCLAAAQQQLNNADDYAVKITLCGQHIDYQEKSADLKAKITELYGTLSESGEQALKIKLRSYLNGAVKAEEKGRIAEALRQYYWANILLNSFEKPDDVRFEELHDGDNVSVWLPMTIKNMLEGVRVQYMGQSEENPDVGILNFEYAGSPITSIAYRYYGANGWSCQYQAKDGRGIVDGISSSEIPEKLTLQIEYTFEEESNIDADIANLLRQNAVPSYRQYAMHTISTKKTPKAVAKSTTYDIEYPASLQVALQRGQTITANAGKYGNAQQLEQDVREVYSIRLANVCTAIQKNNAASVKGLFTKEGYELFDKLVARGKVKILNKDGIRYYKLGDNVVARAVQMSFDFRNNNKKFVEDVVFEFDKSKQICNVRYNVERSVWDNIMMYDNWGDTTKMALVDFLENYRTSYALKDIKYLEQVFSDDAVIITGRVVKKAPNKENIRMQEDEVEYTRQTKAEFINRLRNVFNKNSFVNLSFSNLELSQVKRFGPNIFGIKVKQDYISQWYGDEGYLFLIVDFENYEAPIIYVRTWQQRPDIEGLGGDGLYNMRDFY